MQWIHCHNTVLMRSTSVYPQAQFNTAGYSTLMKMFADSDSGRIVLDKLNMFNIIKSGIQYTGIVMMTTFWFRFHFLLPASSSIIYIQIETSESDQ